MTATKPCAVCSRAFARPADVSATRWAAQRCCSVACGRRLAGTLSSMWAEADIALAEALRASGRTWRQVWLAVAPGRSSPDALRIAVTNARRNPLRGRVESTRCGEPEMDEDTAAAILSRPPARIAVRLAQLPACELRLCEWPYP